MVKTVGYLYYLNICHITAILNERIYVSGFHKKAPLKSQFLITMRDTLILNG